MTGPEDWTRSPTLEHRQVAEWMCRLVSELVVVLCRDGVDADSAMRHVEDVGQRQGFEGVRGLCVVVIECVSRHPTEEQAWRAFVLLWRRGGDGNRRALAAAGVRLLVGDGGCGGGCGRDADPTSRDSRDSRESENNTTSSDAVMTGTTNGVAVEGKWRAAARGLVLVSLKVPDSYSYS